MTSPLYSNRNFSGNRNDSSQEPFSVIYDEEKQEYVVEGARIEKMLGVYESGKRKGIYLFPEVSERQWNSGTTGGRGYSGGRYGTYVWFIL